MKQKFSTKWKESKQKRKQRKYRFNLPLHLKRKVICSNLSKELRKKYNRRSISLRKGDIVKIMRGSFKKKIGKVVKVDRKNFKVYVEGIQKSRRDGTKVNFPLEPSNLQIQELNLEDKKRKVKIEKK